MLKQQTFLFQQLLLALLWMSIFVGTFSCWCFFSVIKANQKSKDCTNVHFDQKDLTA